ncbi:MAG: glycosyltransferase [Rhodospirillaceae bacterium]|nr:glycosyltransferase [Rhodospirillaceae bacterium]
MIRVFIGYDPREAAAFSVLVHSIHKRATQPVCVVPLMLTQLAGSLTRPREPLQSSDFSFSRFLTPHLVDYRGWAIFMDCDMIMREDIGALWHLRDERFAVMAVKHNHVPSETKKFLDEPQSKYGKKNWSSVMLFNCDRCRALTPAYVNAANGLKLHQFKWLKDDSLIGELPSKWNHLVGVSAPRPDAALVHYTIGGPYFDEYRDCEYSAEWFAERDDMMRCDQRATSPAKRR